MEYWRKRELEAAERIRKEVAKPLPEDSESCGAGDRFDPWAVFDGIVGAYDGAIDQMAIATLEAVRDQKTFDLLKGESGLFVQFFLHILAGHDYVEYGTSPRGAWFTHGAVDALADEWISKWRAWYEINWEGPFPS